MKRIVLPDHRAIFQVERASASHRSYTQFRTRGPICQRRNQTPWLVMATKRSGTYYARLKALFPIRDQWNEQPPTMTLEHPPKSPPAPDARRTAPCASGYLIMEKRLDFRNPSAFQKMNGSDIAAGMLAIARVLALIDSIRALPPFRCGKQPQDGRAADVRKGDPCFTIKCRT